MNRYYKKFYEVGDNKYYKLEADGQIYIATESLIDRKGLFGVKKFSQGFKLLKLTPQIMILFARINELEIDERSVNDDTPEELYKYAKFKKDIRFNIEESYEENNKLLKEEALLHKNQLIEEATRKYSKDEKTLQENLKLINDRYANQIKVIEENSPIGRQILLYDEISEALINSSNIKFIYSEVINSIAKNVYYYDLDSYGTVTIYKFITIKNVIKAVESHIYNKKIIEELSKII